jgi:TolB-like protein
MSEPIKAVFLSYASQDAEAARRICEAFRAAGIEVWFDQSELRGGDAWDRRIRKQIHDCALVVTVISAHTEERTEGYFRLEWKLAVDRSHLMAEDAAFLIPVVIDGTSEATARVPDKFREVQWTHLPAGETSPAFVQRVSHLLSPGQAHAPAAVKSPTAAAPHAAAAPRQPPPTPAASRPAQRVLLAIAAVVVIGVGYLAVGKFVLSKRPAAAIPSSAPSGQSAAPAEGAILEKSIAVLPFVDMSEKHDQEYFSDGLSEELIDHLARSQDLKVIARTSSFQFKGKNEDVRSIAGKLGVANLLEGSVRTAAHQVRVTAQLIRASDGTHLWSQTYDQQMSDIFKVQDEIAVKVVQALNAALTASTVDTSDTTRNTDAYKLQLKGDFFYYRSDKGDYDRAIEQYKQALALDPKYSLAWAKLGRVYVMKGQFSELKGAEAASKARDALLRAQAIDPNSAVTHRWLGRIHEQYEWDWKAARKEYERAIALDPGGADGRKARMDLVEMEAYISNQWDEVVRLAQGEAARSPLDASTHWFLGITQYYAGHLADSLASWRRVLELAPTFSQAQGDVSAALLLMGRNSEAFAAGEKETDDLVRLVSVAGAYWALGRKTDSDIALRETESKFGEVGAFLIATVHAYRDDPNAAFAWLERAYSQRDPLMQALKVEPYLKSLHGDPRYKALLRKMNLLDDSAR